MSVVIRLSRGGAKKRPFYHIVATDRRSRRDGRRLESLGYFNPMPGGDEPEIFIHQDRFDYWVGVGAALSPRVSSLAKKYKALPTSDAQKDAREKKLIKAKERRKAKALAEKAAVESSTDDNSNADSTDS